MHLALWGVLRDILEKICFNDSLEIFMTHTAKPVSTPSSQLRLCHEGEILLVLRLLLQSIRGIRSCTIFYLTPCI